MIIPGQCFESKEGGMYVALERINSRQWELLVLLEDKRYNDLAGTIGYANTDWLKCECRRVP